MGILEYEKKLLNDVMKVEARIYERYYSVACSEVDTSEYQIKQLRYWLAKERELLNLFKQTTDDLKRIFDWINNNSEELCQSSEGIYIYSRLLNKIYYDILNLDYLNNGAGLCLIDEKCQIVYSESLLAAEELPDFRIDLTLKALMSLSYSKSVELSALDNGLQPFPVYYDSVSLFSGLKRQKTSIDFSKKHHVNAKEIEVVDCKSETLRSNALSQCTNRLMDAYFCELLMICDDEDFDITNSLKFSSLLIDISASLFLYGLNERITLSNTLLKNISDKFGKSSEVYNHVFLSLKNMKKIIHPKIRKLNYKPVSNR